MKINKYLIIAFIGLFSVSCSEDTMDEINKDNQNPPSKVINAKFQITDAITSTAFTTIGGAYAWNVSSFTEQIFGCGNNQLMNAELRDRLETMASTTYNNEWNGTYGSMSNLKEAIEKCAEGGLNAGEEDILGMAKTLMAISLGNLTDLHGDIPYSEALQVATIKAPKLDKQSDIYGNIFTLLDEAVTSLTKAQTEKMKNAGSQDILFGNDNSQWIGLAHAVRARYLLHTYGRDRDILNDVIDACNNAISAGFEGAELSIFNGVTCDNSWAAFFWSRYYSASSKTVSDLLTARNDERMSIYSADFFGTNRDGVPGDRKDAQSIQSLNAPLWLDNGAATIHIMSKSELYFILAESQARLGQDAYNAYKTAVEASFEDFAVSSNSNPKQRYEYSKGFIENYFVENKSLYEANPLNEIMIQKYISQSRDEQIQTYNDIRRCEYVDGKYPVTLTNPLNKIGNDNNWPNLLPYGNSDVVSNPNVKAAYGDGTYIFTKKAWIFGGE